jgi:hypothetical protein
VAPKEASQGSIRRALRGPLKEPSQATAHSAGRVAAKEAEAGARPEEGPLKEDLQATAHSAGASGHKLQEPVQRALPSQGPLKEAAQLKVAVQRPGKWPREKALRGSGVAAVFPGFQSAQATGVVNDPPWPGLCQTRKPARSNPAAAFSASAGGPFDISRIRARVSIERDSVSDSPHTRLVRPRRRPTSTVRKRWP